MPHDPLPGDPRGQQGHGLDPHSLTLLALGVARRQGAGAAAEARLGSTLLDPDGGSGGHCASREPVVVATVTDGDGGTGTASSATSGSRLEVVTLPGVTLLAGPARLVSACHDIAPEELMLESRLLRLARRLGHDAARSTGEASFYAAAELPPIEAARSVAVSDSPEDVRAVAAQCPADDVSGAGLPAWEAATALVPDDGAGAALDEPVAAAGHTVHGGLLAEVGVLTAPRLRGRGLGAYAAAVACERAYLDGLVPTACVPADAQAAHHLAVAIGLRPVGHVSGLRLG